MAHRHTKTERHHFSVRARSASQEVAPPVRSAPARPGSLRVPGELIRLSIRLPQDPLRVEPPAPGDALRALSAGHLPHQPLAQHERAGDLRQHAGHRPGGDTWRVVKDARGNRSFRVWERFPGSNWGYLNCDSAVLAPGPEGAIATVRYEVLREGLQECGARVAIEQALIDQAQLAPRKGRSSAPHGCPAHGLLDSIPPPVRMALVMQGEGTTPAFETPKTRILASLKRGTGAMKCQKCTKPATLHITEILGEDQFEELHLCEECAHKYLYEPAKAGAGKTAAVPQSDEGEEVGTPNHECPVCGIKFVEFRNSGRLGCPHDYQEFRDELLPLLENIHGDPPRHTGKVPRRLPQNKQTQSELMQLRKQLLQAVNKEAYEEAARLRDRIRQLEES